MKIFLYIIIALIFVTPTNKTKLILNHNYSQSARFQFDQSQSILFLLNSVRWGGIEVLDTNNLESLNHFQLESHGPARFGIINAWTIHRDNIYIYDNMVRNLNVYNINNGKFITSIDTEFIKLFNVDGLVFVDDDILLLTGTTMDNYHNKLIGEKYNNIYLIDLKSKNILYEAHIFPNKLYNRIINKGVEFGSNSRFSIIKNKIQTFTLYSNLGNEIFEVSINNNAIEIVNKVELQEKYFSYSDFKSFHDDQFGVDFENYISNRDRLAQVLIGDDNVICIIRNLKQEYDRLLVLDKNSKVLFDKKRSLFGYHVFDYNNFTIRNYTIINDGENDYIYIEDIKI